MTFRSLGVVFMGIGLIGLAARAVTAQAVQPGLAGQQVAAQIIPADQEDDFAKGALAAKTPGLVQPKATRRSDPKYTPDALRAKIEGDVTVEAIVGVDGRVEKARVKEALNAALDAQALRAIEQWQFEPGTLNGQPVRVLIEVQMSFRVHR